MDHISFERAGCSLLACLLRGTNYHRNGLMCIKRRKLSGFHSVVGESLSMVHHSQHTCRARRSIGGPVNLCFALYSRSEGKISESQSCIDKRSSQCESPCLDLIELLSEDLFECCCPTSHFGAREHICASNFY